MLYFFFLFILYRTHTAPQALYLCSPLILSMTYEIGFIVHLHFTE